MQNHLSVSQYASKFMAYLYNIIILALMLSVYDNNESVLVIDISLPYLI